MEVDVLRKLKNKMKGLGFTDSEIKAYLTLVTHGGLSAVELSERTGIPMTKIYSVLKKLREKEWVIISNTRPTIFYPSPPIEAWNHVKKKLLSEIEILEDFFVKDLQSIYNATRSGAEVVLSTLYMVYGYESIINSIIDLLEKKCSGDVMIALPFKEIIENGRLIEKIKWLSSSFEIKFLASKELKNSILKRFKNSKLKIRVRDKLFGGGIICNEVMFIVKNKGLYVGLRSDMDFFVNLARIYFEYLWKDGEIVMLT
ncbi:MAG: hypothetical protein DRJ44_04380 [Thermoprotei archaeon]|nr:MAG: hypothetical protein DRJ44_04380 [Thermoprotei archaeon]